MASAPRPPRYGSRCAKRGGAVLVDKVLRPGESLTLPNRPNLLLTTGNALNTEFLVDGETTPASASPRA